MDDNFHAEGTRNLRHGFAQRAIAEQAQSAAGQIADGMAEQAEALGLLPQARFDVGTVGHELAAQREDQANVCSGSVCTA
jgi:hypothetical protein